MSYIGSTPTTQSFIAGTDYFSGTGSQTAFTLSRSVVSVNDIQATVNNVVQVPNDAYTVSGTTITFTSAPSAGTNNVYVRYLSTTTQSITPSQGTVGWAQLNSDTQQDLGISFKNRIINGNMVIDQRYAGTATANTINDFVVDRWVVGQTATGKLIAQQNAGSVTPPAGFTNYLGVTSQSAYSIGSNDIFRIYQTLEGYSIADFGFGTANAKTVTLSFWVRSSLTGVFGGALNNASGRYPFTYTINSANTWEYKSVTIVGSTTLGNANVTNGSGISLNFSLGTGSTFSGTAGVWSATNFLSATGATSVVGTSGATFYITGVQLEVGTQATTFTTAGGSYGAELALCQRYFTKSFATTTAPANSAAAACEGVSASFASSYVGSNFVPFLVTMRAVPTLTHYSSGNGTPSNGVWQIYDGGWVNAGSINGSNITVNGFQNSWYYASATLKSAYYISGHFTASAEL